MYLLLFIKGILAGWITAIPLGPVGILCVQRTLKNGRTQGFISSLGATVADAIYAVIACLGVTMLIRFIQEKQTVFHIISGIIITLFGIFIVLKSSSSSNSVNKDVSVRSSYSADFLSGFAFTISNPLTLFFFLAYFAGMNVYNEDSGISHSLVLISGVLTGSVSWFYALSGMAGYFREKIRSHMLLRINKWCGIALLLSGAAIFIKLFFF